MEIDRDLTLIIPKSLSKKNNFLFNKGKLGLCYDFPKDSLIIKSEKSKTIKLILQQNLFTSDLTKCLELYKDFLNEKNFTIIDNQKRFVISSGKNISSIVRNDNKEVVVDWSKTQAFSTSSK
ncbi:hypothetical protein D3C87_39330 [compost metagenome]